MKPPKLTPESLSSELAMQRMSSDKCFVLVEGDTDKRFYQNLFSPKLCQFFPCEGRDNLIQTLKLAPSIKKLIGIRDADFLHLTQHYQKLENEFLTDFHDFELFCLASPAFDKLINQLIQDEKQDKLRTQNLKARLLTEGSKIGLLQWHSEKNGLDLKFETLEADKFFNNDKFEVKLEDLIKHVLNKSEKPHLPQSEKDKIKTQIEADLKLGHNVLHVCIGKHLILLFRSIVHKHGTEHAKTLKTEHLQDQLSLAYEKAHFAQTQLYQDLNTWGKKNTIQFFE